MNAWAALCSPPRRCRYDELAMNGAHPDRELLALIDAARSLDAPRRLRTCRRAAPPHPPKRRISPRYAGEIEGFLKIVPQAILRTRK
jgi:hypothetical protein